jgi:hypothetical protein
MPSVTNAITISIINPLFASPRAAFTGEFTFVLDLPGIDSP